MRQISILISLLSLIYGCKKMVEDPGSGDIGQLPSYYGGVEPQSTNLPKDVRAAVFLSENEGFFVSSSLDTANIVLFNDLGNSLTPFVTYSHNTRFHLNNHLILKYELKDPERSFENRSSSIYCLNASSHKNTFFTLPAKNNFWTDLFRKNWLVDGEEKEVNVLSENGVVETFPFETVGNEDGAVPDPYGNTIYMVRGSIRYIKSTGGLLELGDVFANARRGDAWYGVDGHYYIVLDYSFRMRIDGKTHTLDTLDEGEFYAQELLSSSVYLPKYDMWASSGETCQVDSKTKGSLRINGITGLSQTQASDNYFYLIHSKGVNRNRLIRIDPIAQTTLEIAPDYDVIDYVVNDDDGGVFYGLNFNDLKSYVCGFSPDGNIVQLAEIQSEEPPYFVNLSKADFKTWE